MIRILAFILALAFALPAFAARSVSVHGYTKRSGIYVAPSHRTAPNKTKADNYGTKGNVNPYTGKEGTK